MAVRKLFALAVLNKRTFKPKKPDSVEDSVECTGYVLCSQHVDEMYEIFLSFVCIPYLHLCLYEKPLFPKLSSPNNVIAYADQSCRLQEDHGRWYLLLTTGNVTKMQLIWGWIHQRDTAI